jgi:hypothetical protein
MMQITSTKNLWEKEFVLDVEIDSVSVRVWMGGTAG